MTTTRWVPALVFSAIASGTALWLQNVLRDTWQIRTLPERVEEWLLLFVPLDLFEQGLQRLGADAKEVALFGTVVGMTALLVALGTFALRVNWTSWRLLGLGVGMWLVAMAGVMPVTGAGFFATGLLTAPVLVNAAYLVVFLGYAVVLIGGRLLSHLGVRDRPTMMAERRALLAGAVGTLLAGGIARLVGSQGGLVASSLPLAAAPTAESASTPRPAPTAQTAQTPPPIAAQATAVPKPTPAVQATPTLEPLPNPPPPQHIARDKDGALTAAGRPKGELATPITANDDFYVVTKNAVMDPIVDAAAWRLVIDGEVNRPVQVDYRTLLALPAVEVTKTLECISNFTAGCGLTSFGCDLISTARWKGARLSDVLNLAGGLKSTAVGLAFLSTDEFSAGLPPEVVDDPETLLVYEMNGEPLPRVHGFPARLLVPGRYGMKNPKWLAGIRAMTQEYQGWYEQRNWNKDGIIKTMARIDVPADGARLTAGPQRVAGIAYAGARGVQAVELSTDDGGTWRPAAILEPMPGKDAMIRWETALMLPAATTVTLTVRATDGNGDVQTEEFQLPQPDGASGRDSITISAA
ncbi:MAG TPA: molybdopterin-dependent oxidoreductase [Chloroflexota bacterium]|nr:molybdopterin-dependent oxidoreductase [Chloroflexota bacterium]